MIRKIIAAIVLVPLGLAIILFAVANRQRVTISLDPFSADAPAFTVALPLFIVILGMLIAGVVIGGVASWLRQAHWRRRTRRLEAETRRLRAETESLRRERDAALQAPPPSTSIASIAYRHPSAA
jgi:uncharacterized integral membrane protein